MTDAELKDVFDDAKKCMRQAYKVKALCVERMGELLKHEQMTHDQALALSIYRDILQAIEEEEDHNAKDH